MGAARSVTRKVQRVSTSTSQHWRQMGYQVIDHNHHFLQRYATSDQKQEARASTTETEDIVITHSQGTIVLWERRTGRQLRSLKNDSRILTISISLDGRLLLSSDLSGDAK